MIWRKPSVLKQAWIGVKQWHCFSKDVKLIMKLAQLLYTIELWFKCLLKSGKTYNRLQNVGSSMIEVILYHIHSWL